MSYRVRQIVPTEGGLCRGTNESQIPVLYEIASQIKCRTTLFRLANKSMSTIVSQVKVEVQIVSQTKWSQKEICRISGSLYS